MKRAFKIVLSLSLFFLIFTPSILSSRAVTVYLPAVSQGQWAEYKSLYETCNIPVPTVCQLIGSSFGGTDYGSVHVVDVIGETVTLNLITVYTNGTGSHLGASVNVSTGESNVTGLTGVSVDYFVLAGGLQAQDKVWDTTGAPTFNQTMTETVLGASRPVNFLNYTSSYSYGGNPVFVSTGLAFDQISGILIELSFYATASNQFGTFRASSAMGMVNNNIWLTPGPPDFTMSSSGPIRFQTGSSGSSRITIIPKNGFSSTINLVVTASPGIGCGLSRATLPGYGSFNMTCRGEAGNYAANLTATSDSATHSIPVPVQVTSAPAPSQPSSNLMLIVYAGIGAVAIIAVLAAYLLLQRKRAGQAAIAPGGKTNIPPAPRQAKRQQSSISF